MPKSVKRKPIVAGNWKMNGLLKSKGEIGRLITKMEKLPTHACDVLICPPATLLHSFKHQVKGSRLLLGAQDCHTEEKGAHTGDLSAQMLKEAGANWIIVGHSERRTDHDESDQLVAQKAKAALDCGAKAIICVGETEAERDAGQTLKVIGRQLKNSIPEGVTAKTAIIAYEPVWAIGTGRTPTLEEIQTVHGFMRKKLCQRFEDGQKMRLLYGGSVKPSNASEILPLEDVDGALVGGASLKASDFWGIIKAYLS